MRNSGVRRDEVFLVTKIPARDLTRDRVLRTGRDSVRRLGVEQVDLLLAHWPNPRVPVG